MGPLTELSTVADNTECSSKIKGDTEVIVIGKFTQMVNILVSAQSQYNATMSFHCLYTFVRRQCIPYLEQKKIIMNLQDCMVN